MVCVYRASFCIHKIRNIFLTNQTFIEMVVGFFQNMMNTLTNIHLFSIIVCFFIFCLSEVHLFLQFVMNEIVLLVIIMKV